MRIVIPLAGKDDNFEKMGQFKPLIDVLGKPLIKWCTDSLKYPFSEKNELIFIVLREHEERFKVSEQLKRLYGNINVQILEKQTEGAACTVLTVKKLINTDEELLIYLADIYFECDLKKEIDSAKKSGDSGVIPCFQSTHPKYSYAVIEKDNYATQVAEKIVISTNASAGFYYFTHGKDFVWAAEEMIRKNLRTKNLFFICPVYQQLIERGDKIKVAHAKYKFGLGYVDEIEHFKEAKKNEKHDTIKIFAHRGIFDNHPENSLSAIKEALIKGFSIEIDVQPTKDGELVVVHDRNLKRVIGIDSSVKDLTLSEIKKHHFVKSSESIATVKEVCELFKANCAENAEMAIHLKDAENVNVAEKIVEVLLESTLIDKTFIFDVTKEVARKIKSKNKFVKIGASVADNREYEQLYDLYEVIDDPNCDIMWLDEWKSFYTEDLLKKSLKKVSYAISPELHIAENHPRASKGYEETWKKLLKWGTHGICTDYPEKLRSLLKD